MALRSLAAPARAVGLSRAAKRRPIRLEAPGGVVTITRDSNGYPSIVARDQLDASFAKGWIHARDRLGQVRLTVMGARGRMMELLGDSPLSRTVDRSVRLLHFTRGLSDHVAAMSPRSRAIVDAYCAGFNEGWRGRPFAKLLATLGVDVGPHTPEDVLLTYRMICFFGLTSFQQLAEMVVAELVQHGADEPFLRRIMGDAADGIDVEAIRAMRISPELAMLATPLGGSNAFAVAGPRSATGGALMMSEAHMEVARFPPIFYFSHEEYEDGQYYQGVGIPGVPWVTMGRTKYVGWTYTFGHADNVDLLIERCSDGEYLRCGTWHAFEARDETVKVRGGEDEVWRFYDNDYGTVAAEPLHGDVGCVRWAGLHENTAIDVDATLSATRCRTVDDLVATHRQLHGISLGAVLGDRSGRIAYVHTGRVDARPDGWSGAYPRPAWEDCEAGAPDPLGEEARPVVVDPEEGFVVSANERVRGPGGQRWQNFPEPDYRWRRLRAILGDVEAPTLRDLVAASYDEHDLMAAEMLEVWRELLPDEARGTDLYAWDGRAGHPRAMALFHALHHEVVRALLETCLEPPSAARVLDELGMLLSFQSHIDPLLRLEQTDALDAATLRELLERAWPRARGAVEDGTWPLPVRARFKSLFTQGKLPAKFRFSSDPVEFPGGPTAPFQTRVVHFEGEEMVGGPAYHYCWDMSDDGGWYHIPGGASELPWGPGYGTGVEDWRIGRFHRLGRPSGGPPDHA